MLQTRDVSVQVVTRVMVQCVHDVPRMQYRLQGQIHQDVHAYLGL